MRYKHWITGTLVITALLVTALPASAATQQVHFKYARAAATNMLDSTLVNTATGQLDTLDYITSDNLEATATAAIDTNVAGLSVHANLWLVVEITGGTDIDTLYLGAVSTMGAFSPVASWGATGDQNNPLNWRWYTTQLATVASSIGLQVSPGTRTFVFPITCNPSGGASWIQHKATRWIIKGPVAGSTTGASMRATLVSRTK